MGRAAEEVEELMKQGISPSEISEIRGVPEDITLRTLTELVGRRRLTRSDMFYSIPAERRRLVEDTLCERYKHKKATANGVTQSLSLRSLEVPWIEVAIVMEYRDAGIALGDLYEDIRFIEINLHDFIRDVLEDTYGKEEKGWWRKGVPQSIRKKCAERREEDEEPVTEPWNYTDLIDLREIIKQKWSVFQEKLPKQVSDKKQLLSDLVGLNQIRKLVMHPVRYESPKEEDFDLVRHVKVKLAFAFAYQAAPEAIRGLKLPARPLRNPLRPK